MTLEPGSWKFWAPRQLHWKSAGNQASVNHEMLFLQLWVQLEEVRNVGLALSHVRVGGRLWDIRQFVAQNKSLALGYHSNIYHYLLIIHILISWFNVKQHFKQRAAVFPNLEFLNVLFSLFLLYLWAVPLNQTKWATRPTKISWFHLLHVSLYWGLAGPAPAPVFFS